MKTLMKAEKSIPQFQISTVWTPYSGAMLRETSLIRINTKRRLENDLFTPKTSK